jgi:hypothetical protein
MGGAGQVKAATQRTWPAANGGRCTHAVLAVVLHLAASGLVAAAYAAHLALKLANELVAAW